MASGVLVIMEPLYYNHIAVNIIYRRQTKTYLYFLSVARGSALNYIYSSQSHNFKMIHYSDVIMSAMASQITGVSIVYWTVGSGVDQSKHQSSESLVFVRGIHRWPKDSPHKGPVTENLPIWWPHYVDTLALALYWEPMPMYQSM